MRAVIPGDDHPGRLTGSINAMLAEIARRGDQFSRHRDRLKESDRRTA